ncbi:MAG: hypothetical protein RBS38_02920 [Bacteroidales bacterium]|jgi:hypothetical protein|nr:hypothetical protein [Bacteroidales bacterium]
MITGKLHPSLRLASSKLLFVLAATFLFSIPFSLSGQEETFKPGGKPEARIFTSLNTTFTEGENHTKFDLTRAYFGYSYNFSKTFSARVVYDAASPSPGKPNYSGMLKFAFLRYKTGKLSVTGGMIPLPEYDASDSKWGYRYVYRPAHELYEFGAAADLGVSAAYNFTPWLSADVTIINGEGYKVLESDSTFKATAGITVTPAIGTFMRLYADNMSKNGINQQTLQFIASYENSNMALSAAYNIRKNHWMQENHDFHAFTVNGSLILSEKARIFGRFDNISSINPDNEPDPWYPSREGQLYLIGLQYTLAPGVNISPNFQGWQPSGSRPFVTGLYLSLDLKL